MALQICPITFREACEFIETHHRHHKKPQGWKFGMAVRDGEKIVGVITVGRPVARMLDDGSTLEVTRCCTDGTKNACSMLYSAAWRAARAMGYTRMITYILAEEEGASIRACGWSEVGPRGGGSWNRDARPRTDRHPTGPKTLWEVRASVA